MAPLLGLFTKARQVLGEQSEDFDKSSFNATKSDQFDVHLSKPSSLHLKDQADSDPPTKIFLLYLRTQNH